jgi:hypothetical protein
MLYVADQMNYRIRQINRATLMVSTIAGTGTSGHTGDGQNATLAQIYSPSGLTFDPALNVFYITETYSVRTYNLSTGVITTFAGTGSVGSGGDNGPATSAQFNIASGSLGVDNNANVVYISDGSNNRIRMVNKTSGIITTIANANGFSGYTGDGGPALQARLKSNGPITYDSIQNIIYFADESNNVIRQIGVYTAPTTAAPTTGAPTTTTPGTTTSPGTVTPAPTATPSTTKVNASTKVQAGLLLIVAILLSC